MNLRHTRWFTGIILSLLCCGVGVVTVYGDTSSNSQYVVTKDVINAGGGRSQSTTYTQTGSLGQSSPLGRSASYLSVNFGGFWGGGMTYPVYLLTVNKSGTGSGTVTGGGINCGPTCSTQTIPCEEHTSIVLLAQEEPDSTFVQWLVDGQPVTGEMTVTSDLTVTAVFDKKPDTDNDGLPDEWEQQIIDADPNDSITTIQDVLPGDDFDGDGVTNEEEFQNGTDPTDPTSSPGLFAEITPMDISGTQVIADIQRLESFRMDLQLRFQQDNQPAELVRDVTVIADSGGLFASTANIGSVQKDSEFPGKIIATTNADGQFSINVQGTQAGRMAFHVEQISGGSGVVLPPSNALSSVQSPFLTAVWQGRQLDFSGGDSVAIRIHDLAQTLAPTFYSSEDPTWEIEGIPFEYVTISKQGYLLFGQQTPLATTDITLQDAPDGLLAPFLDDLIVKPESRVYVNWDWGIEPCFTVQWCRMGHVSDPDASITFQIQLWQRSQQVRVVYDLLKNGSGNYADGHDAVIGFKYASDKVYAWTQPLSSFSALEVIDPNASSVDVFALDADQDQLEKADEESLGTDPDNWDSDFDGMSDGWEQTFGLNPLQPDASADADGDGYLNIIEYYLGSKPNNPNSPEYCEPDTDTDGMPDSWELTYGLNPNATDDALVDTDHDWYVNLLEYAIGGDPTDAAIQGTHPAEPKGGISHATYP